MWFAVASLGIVRLVLDLIVTHTRLSTEQVLGHGNSGRSTYTNSCCPVEWRLVRRHGIVKSAVEVGLFAVARKWQL